MATLLEGIAEKYQDSDDDEYGFILFVSNSPDSKRGMLPPIMSLCDGSIERVGRPTAATSASKLAHVSELDLTKNSFSEWSEVLQILTTFPNLVFLNLSQNQLRKRLSPDDLLGFPAAASRPLPLRKLVLNCNAVDWESLNGLAKAMPRLEEIHLSCNGLENPTEGQFGHANLRTLYLTCNSIDSFEAVREHLGAGCPNLEVLSMAECPLTGVPKLPPGSPGLAKLTALNVNSSKISSWNDVDNFRTFPALTELRIKNCPLLDEYTAHERRSLLVARLPNVSIFNGGDKISSEEREDAERTFVRYYLEVEEEEEEKPRRYGELVAVHGELGRLVNISMKPDTHVKVTISARDEEDVREEVISVYQTVAQFKSRLHHWFRIPVQNMRLYYCDQVLVKVAGPEEMKWQQKELYTYNVREGDSFILDEKAPLSKPKANGGSKGSSCRSANGGGGGSPVFPSSSAGQRTAVTMAAVSPKSLAAAAAAGKSGSKSAAQVARNLFGSENVEANNNNNSVKKAEDATKHHSAGT